MHIKELLKDKYWRMNNLYYVQDKQRKTVRFRLNNIQDRMFKERTGRDIWLKARQQTISTFFMLDYLDDCLFLDNTEARTIADAEENLPKLFHKAKFAYDNLPDPIKVLYPLKRNTKYEMYFERRNSHYLVCLQTHSDTVNRLHFSEVAFMKNDKAKIEESTEAVPMDMENTKIDFESIADGVGNQFYLRYIDAKFGKGVYTGHFFRWFDFTEYQLALDDQMKAKIIASLTEDEIELIAEHKLTPEQIAWRREKIAGFSGSYEQKLETFKVKYPENDVECFLVTGNNVFDQKVLDGYLTEKMYYLEPIRIVSIGMFGTFEDNASGEFEIYEEPQEGEDYVVGADVSKGIAKGDYASIFVFKRRTFSPVAKYKGHCSPEILGAYAVFIASYYKNALLAIERNDRGYSAIAKARSMNYGNLYYMGMETGKTLTEYGWHTNSKTKPQMIDQFAYDFRTGFFDKLPHSLLLEMKNYIQDDSNKFGAIQGEHDDEIIGCGIALMLCYLFPYKHRRNRKEEKKLDYTKKFTNESKSVYSKKTITKAINEYKYGLL